MPKKNWNRARALQFLGGDEDLLKDLAALFVERNGFLLENVETAIRSQDAMALHDAAHAYKGAVNHFSATRVRDSAFALEHMGRTGNLAGAEALFEQLRSAGGVLLEELWEYVTSDEDGSVTVSGRSI